MCLGCSRSLQVGSIVMFEDDKGYSVLGAVQSIIYQDRKPVMFVTGHDINLSKEKNGLDDYVCFVLGTGQYSGGYQETYKVPATKLRVLTIGHEWNYKEEFAVLKKHTFPFYYADKYDEMIAQENALRAGAEFVANPDTSKV